MQMKKRVLKQSVIVAGIMASFLIFGLVSAPSVLAADSNTIQLNDKYKDELWGAEKIQVVPLWSLTKGSGVVVAVIDTGVDYNHEDLAENIWINANEISGNGIDDDKNGYIDDVRGWDFFNSDNDPLDDNGHGTTVAGVIAAVGNNGKGIAGVAMDAEIMALKCMGSDKSGNTTKAVWAIKYAMDNGANIINISWSASAPSVSLDNAIDSAIEKGIIVIASSGNHYSDVSSYFPASNKKVITVAAINKKNERAKFSNWGNAIDVAAPGAEIKTTFLGGYKETDGTSVAAGYVSGLSALLLHYAPALDNQEVEAILRSSAGDLGSAGWDEYYGAGLVNGMDMLKHAVKNYSGKMGSNFSADMESVLFSDSFGRVAISPADAEKSDSKSDKYKKLYKKYKKYKIYKSVYLEVKNLKATNSAAYYQVKTSEKYDFYKKYLKYKTYKDKANK